MPFLINVISFFWFARTIKFVLFWIYLWQLKEYHIGRFTDHFRTHKGKKLIFDPLLIVKIFLLPLILINYLFIYILLLIYITEFLVFGLGIAKRNFKKPILTFKTILLSLVSFTGVILYLFLSYKYVGENSRFIFALLIFDILIPIFISAIVLLFQPFFVLVRNIILEKAKEKIKKINNLTVIGITGSYGKTSTKEFLTTILSQKFNVLSTLKHKNSEIGIAQTILKDLNAKHEIFIVEMGSYKKGGIKLLCDIVKPKIGIITGVNEQHLALFGSQDNLLSAEGGRELVESLPKNGLIVLNGDNKYCLNLYKKIYEFVGNNIEKKIYTTKKDKISSNIWTEDITVYKDYISFIARSKEKEMAHFSVNVLGKQNVQNLLGAILVAKEFGMDFGEISEACKNIQQNQASIILNKGIYGIDIIDSSHSSNPDGVIADLDYLNIFPKKKVVVMPCLIELGNKSSEIHYAIGKKIAEICDLAIITTKDKFKEIKKGAAENGMPKDRILLCDKSKEIFAHITTFCKEGDAVLLEGRVPKSLIEKLNV